MGVFEFFSSRDKRAKLSHLKNLVVLSVADGNVEKPELATIAAVCSREGLTESDLQKCINDPESIEFVPPTDDKTRLRYLEDMVLLMMSDGNIDNKEMLVCKVTAKALGYKPEVIDAMLLNIIAELSEKIAKDGL